MKSVNISLILQLNLYITTKLLQEHILKDHLDDGTFTVDQVKFKNREKSTDKVSMT
ncbi:hypothetical protein Hanom_Chr04g00284241 [Helianthus anomalus]